MDTNEKIYNFVFQVYLSAIHIIACDMMKLRQENGLRIFGGCCGTDYRHMEEVARLLTTGAGL